MLYCKRIIFRLVNWRLQFLIFRVFPLFIFSSLLLCTITIIFTNTPKSISEIIEEERDKSEKLAKDGFYVRSPGCTIPAISPFNLNIQGFIDDRKPPKCYDGLPPLIKSDHNSMWVVPSSLSAYNVTDATVFGCCYRNFSRVDPTEDFVGKKAVKYNEECVVFENRTTVEVEFVTVICVKDGLMIYRDFFAFVPPKKPKVEPPEDAFNVLVVGIDSVSRQNLVRQMPLTVSYLLELESVELLGYNKVGENTFPNLVPFFSGLNEKELEEVCWRNQSTAFDECPFIWKEFGEKGFLTAYGETATWMGTFNYQRKGFRKAPTDYFFDTFMWEAETVVGSVRFVNAYMCVGPRQPFEVELEYVDKLTETMRLQSQPYFGFFWEVPLGHDRLSTPKWGDSGFAAFFRHLEESGRLANTVLIFMSDHGIRWGDIHRTLQGRVEERMPFVHLVLPKRMRSENPRAFVNLLRNKHKLTTPFDLHLTLRDLLDPSALTPEFLESRASKRGAVVPRGYSLFDVIPDYRTCADAGIAPHWCLCRRDEKLSMLDVAVWGVASFAVDSMNDMLADFPGCAVLELERIVTARLLIGGEGKREDPTAKDYTVGFVTTPGGGIFEATVRKLMADYGVSYLLLGMISRHNSYGTQNMCVKDPLLKLYCYCNIFDKS